MAYRKKEDWLVEADRLGLDVEGLSWPELQKTVSQALKREEYGMMDRSDPVIKSVAKEMVDPVITNMPKEVYRENAFKAMGTDTDGDRIPVQDIAKAKQKMQGGIIGKLKKSLWPEEAALKQFAGQELKLAPEIYPDAQRAAHYKEELGDDLIVDEKHYDIRGLEFDATSNVDSGTYIIKGRTGEKVVATSAIPKEQPGLFFRPDMDYAVVVNFMGRSGYLWTHHRLPNIKALLRESGYYEEYKHMFKDEPNIWYSAGLLTCDPSVVHHVFKEIEEKERIKRERGY